MRKLALSHRYSGLKTMLQKQKFCRSYDPITIPTWFYRSTPSLTYFGTKIIEAIDPKKMSMAFINMLAWLLVTSFYQLLRSIVELLKVITLNV